MSNNISHSKPRFAKGKYTGAYEQFLNIKAVFILAFIFVVFIPIYLKAENQKTVDADVISTTRKNTNFIKRKHIRFYQLSVKVGKEKFLISVFTKQGHNSQKYLVIHDSEDAAFDAGLRAIQHGGMLIALENNENRSLYSFGKKGGTTGQDPNRMFNKDNPYWPVAKKILELLDATSGSMIIALHNNKPGGNFNLGHIQKWKNISVVSREDPDSRSMIWIPGPTPTPNRDISREVQAYNNSGLNVVYEYVPENSRGDGSLSVYAAKHCIPYRNIEVEAGVRGNRRSELKSRRTQIKYLNALRKYHHLK